MVLLATLCELFFPAAGDCFKQPITLSVYKHSNLSISCFRHECSGMGTPRIFWDALHGVGEPISMNWKIGVESDHMKVSVAKRVLKAI